MFKSNTMTHDPNRTRGIFARFITATVLIAGLGMLAGPALSAPGDPFGPDPFDPDPFGPDPFDPEPDPFDPFPEDSVPDFDFPDDGIFIPFPDSSDLGNLVEFQPQTKALAADVNKNFSDVKEALNAKTAGGIDYVADDGNVDILGNTTVAAITVDMPYKGQVVVEFSAQLEMDHTPGQGDTVRCSIKTAQTNALTEEDRLVGSLRRASIVSGQADGLYYPSLQSTGVYQSLLSGEVTFYAQCTQIFSDVGVIAHTLTAIYQEDRL